VCPVGSAHLTIHQIGGDAAVLGLAQRKQGRRPCAHLHSHTHDTYAPDESQATGKTGRLERRSTSEPAEISPWFDVARQKKQLGPSLRLCTWTTTLGGCRHVRCGCQSRFSPVLVG
jgi:hypothetical protein